MNPRIQSVVFIIHVSNRPYEFSLKKKKRNKYLVEI